MSFPSDFMAFHRLLDCGHYVVASEVDGGFDEVPTVMSRMVYALLDFKVETHNCERFERVERVRAEGRPFG